MEISRPRVSTCRCSQSDVANILQYNRVIVEYLSRKSLVPRGERERTEGETKKMKREREREREKGKREEKRREEKRRGEERSEWTAVGTRDTIVALASIPFSRDRLRAGDLVSSVPRNSRHRRRRRRRRRPVAISLLTLVRDSYQRCWPPRYFNPTTRRNFLC